MLLTIYARDFSSALLGDRNEAYTAISLPAFSEWITFWEDGGGGEQRRPSFVEAVDLPCIRESLVLS